MILMDNLIHKYIQSLPNKPTTYDWGTTYESITFTDGTIKPSREDFEEKINVLKNTEAFLKLREERDKRLIASDWTQSRDVSLNNDSEWLTYRQQLRNLPSNSSPQLDNEGNLTNVTWPTRPS